MARFYEPWRADKSKLWDIGLTNPPWRDDPEERAQAALEWEGRRFVAERDADWIIRGTDMSPIVPLRSILGTESISSGREILFNVRKSLGWPQDGPSHADVAIRVADCVNAMAGVVDPCKTIREIKSVLTDLARCETGFDDDRILMALAMLGVGMGEEKQ